MSTTYEITNGEVIPYTSGRRCSDTRSWREATDLEMQQLHTINEHEQTIAKQREVIEELMDELKSAVTQFGCNCGHPACRGCRDAKEIWAAIRKAEAVLG